MKYILRITLIILSFAFNIFAEEEAWTIQFTNPTNGSTYYNVSGPNDPSDVQIDFHWTVSASFYWAVKLKVDGNYFPYNQYIYDNSLTGRAVDIGTHTATVELYYVPTLGALQLKATQTISFTASSGYLVKAKNNFSGGNIILDGVNSFLPHHLQFVSKRVIPGTNVSFEAIDNQTDDNGYLQKFFKWTNNIGGPTTEIAFTQAISYNNIEHTANFQIKPSSPQNISNIANTGNVQIGWSAIPEPVLQHYEIERKLGSGNWVVIATTTSLTFTDNEITYDNDPYANAFDVTAFYRARAKSTAGIYSEYTNIVTVNGRHIPEKRGYLKQKIEFGLDQNYPNPFNPTTEIKYSIAEPSFVTLTVFNSAGQEVAQLVKEYKGIGDYSVSWNAVNLPSGVYIYSFTAGKYSSQKKMMLVK